MLFYRVALVPQNLDELGEALLLWENLNNGKPEMEAKFQPLYDQFSVLEKYEVYIPDELHHSVNNLSTEWLNFQQAIVDADVMLKKVKVAFFLLWLISHCYIFIMRPNENKNPFY